MKKLSAIISLFILTAAFAASLRLPAHALASQGKAGAHAKKGAGAKYVPVEDFDPKRDAAADVERAVAEAKRTNRNVLLDVGGKWCVWCRILDAYFESNPDLLKLRDDNYVTLKINFGPENENKALLSKYPEPRAYPHIYVLDAEGKLLQSQGTGELEEGRSYNREKMIGFLKKWAPSK